MQPWIRSALDQLDAGKVAVVKPRGRSMEPLIKDGEEVRIRELKTEDVLKQGDIVFVRIGARHYLHKILKVNRNGKKLIYLIGNNHGKRNGWVEDRTILGIFDGKVEDA